MDYGLLQGIGEGLKSGVGAYQAEQERRERTRQRDIENKMRADEREMILADKGLIKNDSGKYEKSPEKIAEESAKRQQERMEKRNNIVAKYADMGLVPEFDDNDNIANVKRGLIPQKAYTPLDPVSAAAKSADIRKTEAEIQKIMADMKKSQGAGATQQKLAGLNATDKARFDNVRMGLGAIKDLDAALAGGSNTFTLFGDNPYTMAAKRWEEAIGRMQSGGAINDEEAERFRGLIPGKWDSKEIQAQKLAQMRNELLGRMETLGFSSQEIPESQFSLKYNQPKEQAVVQQQGLVSQPSEVVVIDGQEHVFDPRSGLYQPTKKATAQR